MKTLVIIVNYKSAGLTGKAVETVLSSESAGPVEVVVVDNSASPQEAHMLKRELSSSVILRANPENMGFGYACNQAFGEFESDWILLMNPDARLLPGALWQMQKTLLSNRNVAAVSPQLFWDEDLTFYLPPPYPTALFEFRDFLVSRGSKALVNRIISFFWRRHSIAVWRANKPVPVGNLSGGLVLLDREAINRAGGLFDPRFFLYFEDTDLFLRLRKGGYKILIDPKARAIHYYDQCGHEEWHLKRRLMAESYKTFVKKHRSSWKSCLKRMIERLSGTGIHENGLNLPVFYAPFSLDVLPRYQREWLFEWSPNPDLVPSAARFGCGPKMRFPEGCWDLLAPGRYFGRLGGIGGGLGRWTKPFQLVSWVIHENS